MVISLQHGSVVTRFFIFFLLYVDYECSQEIIFLPLIDKRLLECICIYFVLAQATFCQKLKSDHKCEKKTTIYYITPYNVKILKAKIKFYLLLLTATLFYLLLSLLNFLTQR